VVVVRALVGAIELAQGVGLGSTLVLLHHSEVCRHLGNNSGSKSGNHVASINCGEGFHTCSHQRGFRTQQGHRLTLHVRTHQGPVRVIVLEERNERGSNRDHLARRNIDIVHGLGGDEFNLSTLFTNQYLVHRKGAIGVQRSSRLSDNEFVLVISGQIVNRLPDLAL